jgi:hypothetical protein
MGQWSRDASVPPFVDLVPIDRATGARKALYDQIERVRGSGRVSNLFKAYAAFPELCAKSFSTKRSSAHYRTHALFLRACRLQHRTTSLAARLEEPQHLRRSTGVGCAALRRQLRAADRHHYRQPGHHQPPLGVAYQ